MFGFRCPLWYALKVFHILHECLCLRVSISLSLYIYGSFSFVEWCEFTRHRHLQTPADISFLVLSIFKSSKDVQLCANINVLK